MGNSKSKKAQHQKEPAKFFERERWKEQKREEMKKKNVNPLNKRMALKEFPLVAGGGAAPSPLPRPVPSSPAHLRCYDDEAVELMRYQLRNDSDAFLLNNILLSVQFFEHYDKEIQYIKSNPISEREHAINDAMVQHHKHVFFADRLLECVHEHVGIVRARGQVEPLATPRLFVIYDNVEASEPGDTSDYSAVLDAPFYKIRIEDCKEQGYVKLIKLEVLESTVTKENSAMKTDVIQSDDSVYTNSEKESNASDDYYACKGEELFKTIETKINNSEITNNSPITERLNDNGNIDQMPGRRCSGPVKQVSIQVTKSTIANMNIFQRKHSTYIEEYDSQDNGKRYADNKNSREDVETKPRKSILKNIRRPSGPTKEMKQKQFLDMQKEVKESVAEDTETSGYRSTSSSRQNEFSESESDYGYSTITASATPKKIELTVPSNYLVHAGVLPEECWNVIQVRAIDNWSEDEEEDVIDSASKLSISRTLYETYHYLGSQSFMNNFVDNFIINIGSSLGLTEDAINNALSQGASVYCDTIKNEAKLKCEVYPALLAAWPNAANQWIIRERRIVQNPRTNLSYQWPTKYMVSKAIGFGCLLVPVGFRPKRGLNPDQKLQWRIIFPAAERYLESCLAHSQVRCYLFTLALHKTFMENETSKIGIDASHIKNHLFWHCEHNFARWPEDRLGESLRIFLDTFYVHFGQAKIPNYFIEACNDFKSIPKPMLMKLQKRLAEIRESPVMHILKALDNLKYTKKDFYPPFNCKRLYDILTSKNPLRILNPNLPVMNTNYDESSESENEDQTNFWDKAKTYDKHYQWKKEKHRQMQEKRKTQHSRKHKSSSKGRQIDTNIVLPKKMEAERKRLVLEFFISHFIAMARSSEKFEDINQALIYLEQAQRLCILLLEEPGGDGTANEFLEVVRDKLADCQRKLVNQAGFKLPRRESQKERNTYRPVLKQRQRPRFEHIVSQNSPTDTQGISAFTFVDVHVENRKETMKLNDTAIDEESKL